MKGQISPWLLVALASAITTASCHHVGVGPSLGYVVGSGVSIGWEATASAAHEAYVLTPGYAKGSIGQSFVEVADGERSAVSFAAWEPWYFAGASLGASISPEKTIAPVLGIWEAAGGAFTGCAATGYGAAVTLGYRFAGFRHEFYVTPMFMYFGQKRFLCYE